MTAAAPSRLAAHAVDPVRYCAGSVAELSLPEDLRVNLAG